MQRRGNDRPNSLGTRGRGFLLPLGDAGIVAEHLALCLGGSKSFGRALADRVALELGNGGEDVDRELGGSRIVDRKEVSALMKATLRDNRSNLAMTSRAW